MISYATYRRKVERNTKLDGAVRRLGIMQRYLDIANAEALTDGDPAVIEQINYQRRRISEMMQKRLELLERVRCTRARRRVVTYRPRVHRSARARRVVRVVAKTAAKSTADPDSSSEPPGRRGAPQFGGAQC